MAEVLSYRISEDLCVLENHSRVRVRTSMKAVCGVEGGPLHIDRRQAMLHQQEDELRYIHLDRKELQRLDRKRLYDAFRGAYRTILV